MTLMEKHPLKQTIYQVKQECYDDEHQHTDTVSHYFTSRRKALHFITVDMKSIAINDSKWKKDDGHGYYTEILLYEIGVY